MTTRLMAPVAGLAALLLAACSGDEATGDLVEVQDSAGVRVVYSAGPQWEGGEGWMVGSSPSVVIGRADGDESELLYRTGPAVRLGNGEVLVVQGSSPPRFRVYDERGAHVRTFGGEGEGPGEFRLLGNVCVTGDTVTGYDPLLGRLTAFSLAGELLGVRRLTPVIGETGIRRDIPVWMDSFGDCDRVGRPNSVWPDQPGPATFAYSRLELDDLEVDTITVVTGGAWAEGPPGSPPRDVQYSTIPWAVAGDSSLFISDNADFWIREFSPEGELRMRFGRAHDTLSIGEDDIRRLEAHLIERAGPEAVSHVRETFETAVYADAWPVHTRRMVVDRVGNLWVHHFVRPWEEVEHREWSVFDAEGVFLGEVRTPAALRVTEIGDDYVLGVWRDSLDVESVRLFPLEKERVRS